MQHNPPSEPGSGEIVQLVLFVIGMLLVIIVVAVMFATGTSDGLARWCERYAESHAADVTLVKVFAYFGMLGMLVIGGFFVMLGCTKVEDE
jgi:flagellar biosynthesis protein FlhB